MLDEIIKNIPAFAKEDLPANLKTALLTDKLSKVQIWGAALTAAITVREPKTKELILAVAKQNLNDLEVEAAYSAASIMAMNNVYWRFWYMVDDKELINIPHNLTHNIFEKHGINEVDFECMKVAASIINQCSGCLRVSNKKLLKAGFSKEQVLAVIRVAAVIHSLAITLSAER